MSSVAASSNNYLIVPIVLLFTLLGTAVVRAPTLVTEAGIGSGIIVAAPVVLATYSLMVLAVSGRGTVDLAVGPLLAFINVVVVKLSTNGILTSPIATFIVAIGLGMIYQFVFALIIIFIRVQPIIVALSGFLALTGINLIILPRPGGVAPEFMMGWGAGTEIFSPVLLIVVIATLGWYLFTASSFYSNLKMTGFDEKAAWTSGIRTDVVRIGAHLIAGIYVGLGAICYTALISSGDPTQGQNMTLTAVTALVLGGISLTGGRGGATGALVGALSLWLIGYVLATFNFGAIQAFMTQMVYGLVLVISLLLTLLVPVISRHLSLVSPWTVSMFLGLIVCAIMLQVANVAQYNSMGEELVSGSLAEKYFLINPASLNTSDYLNFSVPWISFLFVLGLTGFGFSFKLVSSISKIQKMGLITYFLVVLLLLGLFTIIFMQSGFQSAGTKP